MFRWWFFLTSTFELKSTSAASGVRVDPKVPHSEGICGFPMVLLQITKILNHSTTNKSSVKTGESVNTNNITGDVYRSTNDFSSADLFLFTDAVGEDQAFSSPFGCCIQEVLLCCHPSLSEECVAARLGLVQRLETICHILSTATDGTGQHGTVRLWGALRLKHIMSWRFPGICHDYLWKTSDCSLNLLSFHRGRCRQCSSGPPGGAGRSEAGGAGRSPCALQHEAAAPISGPALPLRARRRSRQTRLCAQFPRLRQHAGVCVSVQPWFRR